MKRPSFVVLLAAVWACAAGSTSATTDDLVFIHHSCGRDWLERGGLHDALLAKDYIDERNDIYYGTDLPPDPARPDSLGPTPGDRTYMDHWLGWFNDYFEGIRARGTADGVNRIVMFKSCYPASNVVSEGTQPGDPFSSTNTVANYQAVYRHASGAGNTYTHGGATYRPLEDVFAANPDTLFIPVTAPPRHYGPSDATTDAEAARARAFNSWLTDTWLPSYRADNPLHHNVAVFDWFDFLAYPADHAAHPNRLRSEYGGGAGNSHPNTDADLASTAAFASGAGNVLDAAWSAFAGQTCWQGGEGDWHGGGNWDRGEPDAARDACIDAGEVQLLYGAAEAQRVRLGYRGEATLLWAGGTLEAGSYDVGPGGTLLVSSGSQDWLVETELNVEGGTVSLPSGGLKVDAAGDANLAGGSVLAPTVYIGHAAGSDAAMAHTGGRLADCWDFSLGVQTGSRGTYTLGAGGRIEMRFDYEHTAETIGRRGEGAFVQTGGVNRTPVLRIGDGAGSSGTYTISGGELTANELLVGGSDPTAAGTLSIPSAAPEITVGEVFRLGAGGSLSAGAGATVRLAGADLEIETTDAAAASGLAELTLVVQDPEGARQSFEAAGRDLGAVADGWVENFAVGSLELGDDANGALLALVDRFDNQPGLDEAVYVEELSIAAGVRIELNGLALYYRNGGQPKQFFHGDCNLDGAVDAADYLAFKRHYGAADADRADGDCDGDRDVDCRDLELLMADFGRTPALGPPPPMAPAAGVPEPAALALLAVGSAGVLLMRRHRRPIFKGQGLA